MEMKHVSDETIQAYLDGEPIVNLKTFLDHIKTCSFCSQMFQSYKAIYSELAREPEGKLSKNFISTVMCKLPASSPKMGFFSAKETLLILGGFFAALGSTIIFVDWKSVFQSLGKTASVDLGSYFHFLNPIKDLIDQLNGSFILLPFAGLALLFTAMIDHLIRKAKTHRPTLL